MKQDLIDLITSGYELGNQLVGDEVVNYNKLNRINYQVVRNLVGEFTTSKDENGVTTADSRLDDNYNDTTVALNEIFNDYNVLTDNSHAGHSIKGGQGNHAEGFHNKLWGTFASNYSHSEGYDNRIITGGHFLLGKDYANELDVQQDGYTKYTVSGYSNHIEGNMNNVLFTNSGHVEGSNNSVIKNDYTHAEGYDTLAYGRASHAEGIGSGQPTSYYFTVSDNYATSVNTINTAISDVITNAASYNNPAKNTFSEPSIYTLMASKAETLNSAIANQFMVYESRTSYIAFAPYSYSFVPNSAFGEGSHTEGIANAAFGNGSHTEGRYNTAACDFAHTEGSDNHAFGVSSHVEGGNNITGPFAVLDTTGKDITRLYSDSTFSNTTFDYWFGLYTSFSPRSGSKLVIDKASFTTDEGSSSKTFIPRTGYQYLSSVDDNYLNLYNTNNSLAGVPFYGVMPWGSNEFVEGYQHAEGFSNVAFGNLVHAEGYRNWAISDLVHIEGFNNLATYGSNKFSGTPEDTSGTGVTVQSTIGKGIHIEGQSNTVYGYGTLHIEGSNNIVDDAKLRTTHIEGYHNMVRLSGDGLHIEGYGNYSYSAANHGAHIEGYEYEYGQDYKWEYNYGTSSYGMKLYTYNTHNYYNYFNQPSIYNVKYGPTTGSDNYRHYYETVDDVDYDSYKYRISNSAVNKGAHAEGSGTAAVGIASHAEGMSYKFIRPYLNTDYVSNRVYEYYFSTTLANGSHLEGLGNFIDDYYTTSTSGYSGNHGSYTIGAHAEGILTKINQGGAASHTEGYNTEISSNTQGAHAEGISTYAAGNGSHTEGIATSATNLGAHAEGTALVRNSGAQDSNGYYTVSDSYQRRFYDTTSISFGQYDIGDLIIYNDGSGTTKTASTLLNENIATYNYDYYKDCPSYGSNGTVRAYAPGAHSEGGGTLTTGLCSHAEGICTGSNGYGSHTEGILTLSTTYGSHAEGIGTLAVGYGAHAEGIGLYCNGATGVGSHIEGKYCKANADAAHSEGIECMTAALGAHAEGYQSQCTGAYGHTEGNNCNVSAQSGHAGGSSSQANAIGSFVHGNNLQSIYSWQTIFGQYNITNSSATQLQFENIIFALGAGTAANNRKNAMEVDKAGNVAFEGDIIFAGGQSLTDIIEELRTSGGGGSSGGASYSSADMNTY